MPDQTACTIEVTCVDAPGILGEVSDLLHALGMQVKGSTSLDLGDTTRLTFDVVSDSRADVRSAVAALSGWQTVREAKITGTESEQGEELLDLVQPHLLAAPPYASVTPPEELARRLGIPEDRIVKLDANENPYGPSPRALEAVANARSYHIYPDPEQRRVREALGEYIGYGPEWIVAGSGSDELIDLLVRMFVPQGEAIVNFPPTFGMYPFLADVLGNHVVNVTRREDFSLDIAAAVAGAREARLVFAVSPNNPSGTLLSRPELDALLATGRPVVVDEAYAEFSGQSYVDLVREKPNLIVLRTLSKWAGLAGLRLGYMVADPALIDVVLRVKQPYNVNAAAEAAALASLADAEYAQSRINAIVRERERLQSLLAQVRGFTVTPSSANFVLCRLEGMEARVVKDRLTQRGIMVRHFDTPLLRNHLRISAGRPQDTDALMDALRDIVTSAGGVEATRGQA